MVRAAAKNFRSVLVVIDPNDYQKITNLLKKKKVDLKLRQELAVKAFTHTAFYDSQIAKHFGNDMFSNEITLAGRKSFELKYGENPHQKASFYIEPNTNSLMGRLKSLSNKTPSLINVVDINAGIKAVELFKESCAVVIKHHTPCGIAVGKDASEALERAIKADPESAFGGVIVINKPIDLKTAKIIASFKEEKKKNIDVIACPSIDKKAVELLRSVRKNMGIYVFGKITNQNRDNKNVKFVDGGFLLQTADNNVEKNFSKWEVVSKKKPTKKQLEQMKAAWKFVSRIKSNSVIIVDGKLPMTRGIGSGQTSRLRSTKIALEQAGKFAKGGILASDSFFPFDDSVRLAAKHKVSAIIQQGDSVNDKLSIEAANKANIPMVLTHTRAFWH
jgi:phosphoribosylaminoimidazolecarboxamide formyltransferase/IMP cyclohydrolase